MLLILDLDNTLLHAILAPERFKHDQDQGKGKDNLEIVQFRGNGGYKFMVKMRPYLMRFLLGVVDNYQIFIYTMGTRDYAESIMASINRQLSDYSPADTPVYQFKTEQIISRNENFTGGYKQIQRIVPCNESMVLILDDNQQVWSKSQNLVYTKKYYFFNETGLQKDQADPLESQVRVLDQTDGYLLFTLSVLNIMHRVFYAKQQSPDVRDIFYFYKRYLLHDLHFAFTGFVD